MGVSITLLSTVNLKRLFALIAITLTFTLAAYGLVTRPISVLSFSTANTIDETAFPTRDMAKPFYFRINGPATFGSYPFTVDIGSRFKVWLDDRTPSNISVSNAAARSLAMSLSAEEDKNVKDKIFLDAVPHAAPERMDLIAANNLRWVSFDFMLDREYELPRFWAIHFQAWQCCSGHPPLAVDVMPHSRSDNKIEMHLVIFNDLHPEKGLDLGTFLASRDEWIHVVLALEPRPCKVSQSGSLRGWINGVQIVDWRGCWGYAPTSYSPISKGELNSHMGLDFGIYRRRQTTKQTVYFDNITYGKTPESVGF